MRKKYENPALLTINFAFDSRLLDLVATTYEDELQTQPTFSTKRSNSEKNISLSLKNQRNSRQNRALNHNSASKNTLNRKSMMQGANIGSIIFQNYSKPSNKTGRGDIKNTNDGQKISNLKKNSPNTNRIDQQVTKAMLKSIRKNILSTNISPAQQSLLQRTYRELLNKMRTN